MNYKGEDYDIDSWAQCEKCNLWRKLSKALKNEDNFLCGDISKKCHIK